MGPCFVKTKNFNLKGMETNQENNSDEYKNENEDKVKSNRIPLQPKSKDDSFLQSQNNKDHNNTNRNKNSDKSKVANTCENTPLSTIEKKANYNSANNNEKNALIDSVKLLEKFKHKNGHYNSKI